MTRMGQVPMMFPAPNATMQIFQDYSDTIDMAGGGLGAGQGGAGAGLGGAGTGAGLGGHSGASGDMAGVQGAGGAASFGGVPNINGGLGGGAAAFGRAGLGGVASAESLRGSASVENLLDGIRVTGFGDFGGLDGGGTGDMGGGGGLLQTLYPYGSLPMPQIVSPNFGNSGSAAVPIPPDFTRPPPGYPEAPRPEATTLPDFSQPPPEFSRS